MRVAMMLYAGFQLLEVSGPMDVFHEANRLYGRTFYESHLIGTSPGPVLCSNGTAVGTTECLAETSTPFDVVVVPGSPMVSSTREHRELVAWLSDAGPSTRRLACISNGAFLLARAGVADHHSLTTHWRDAHRLAAEFPRVHVSSDPGCMKDGNLYSSGGASAGIHLALSIVREDLGETAADTIAGTLLMQPR
ncbi:AraC family transcriptional regulator [Paraburkholderia guartelaensis]|jgi:transcriptional regulator GlxA family with amidase domain|uniref:AraC family transcriptional regulator n=1 Tax=Paraburkholderia guartelaensis TaxID=2546446 RepID=A0A4R5LLY9_9BURK|nr:AraC family transcriptional regulator [Paraburkholderia guartelaensis]TDG10833.1 AraC family transcriptional regulator [Paraburkholderia guartelaensis]